MDHGFGSTLYQSVDIMTPGQRWEYAADSFAATLMMPRDWIERFWRRGDQRPQRRRILKMAECFDVLPACLWLRLAALPGLDNVPDWPGGQIYLDK